MKEKVVERMETIITLDIYYKEAEKLLNQADEMLEDYENDLVQIIIKVI